MVVPRVEFVGTIITILYQIVALVQTAESNRRKCRLLKERVDLIVRFLEELRKSPWMLDSATEIMLNQLRDATNRALALVESCQRKKKALDFKSHKKAGEFAALQKQITYTMDNFHIANRILMLNLNKQQFFMTALEKLLLDGACKRLPQNVKEDLKSSIRGLENCDHMSPDAEKVLEMIVSDLNCRAATSSGTTSAVATGVARATGGNLVDDVVRIANDVLEAARTVKVQNMDEVQQLSRYAEQAIDLLQQLHVPAGLTRDTVRSLGDALGEGRDIVRRYIQQHTRSVQLVPRCGGEGSGPGGSNSNDISSVLYRIEYDLHIILVSACKSMHKN